MKIEFSRADIERILLAQANMLCPLHTPFDTVERDYNLPSSITVSVKEEDAAQ